MTELALVPTYQDDQEVIEAQSQVLTVADQARAIQILDDADYNLALSVLAQCRKASKRFDDLKKRWTAPLKKQVKEQCDLIERDLDEMAAPAREADTLLVTKTNAWRLKVAELARKAQEHDRLKQERAHDRAVERAEAKGVEPPPLFPIVPTYAPPAKTVETTDGSKVTFRKTPHFEVVDPNQVPPEFWSLDLVKIGTAVRGGLYTPDRPIPGVRIWVTEEPSIR